MYHIKVINDSHELYQWCVKTFGTSKCEHNSDGIWKRLCSSRWPETYYYVFDNESDLVLFKMVNGYNDNR